MCCYIMFLVIKKKKQLPQHFLLLLLSLNYHQSKDCLQGGSVGKESAAVFHNCVDTQTDKDNILAA